MASPRQPVSASSALQPSTMFVSFAPRGMRKAAVKPDMDDADNHAYVPCGPGFETTLGARLALGASRASAVSLIVNESDGNGAAGLSASTVKTLTSWGVKSIPAAKLRTSSLIRSSQPPKKRAGNIWGLKKNSLPTSELKAFYGSAAFHFQGLASELNEKLDELSSLRKTAKITARPIIAWEPEDTTFDPLVGVLSQVDVVYMDINRLRSVLNSQAASLDKQVIELDVQVLLDAGIGPDRLGTLVVRCEGAHLVASRQDGFFWVPTFHDPLIAETLSSSSGPSSVFLGAFTVQLLQWRNIQEAALYGAVAESFAVEQQGLPRRDSSPYAAAAATFASQQYGLPMGHVPNGEVWNMDGFKHRVQLLRAKVTALTRVRQAALSRRLSGETLRNEEDFFVGGHQY